MRKIKSEKNEFRNLTKKELLDELKITIHCIDKLNSSYLIGIDDLLEGLWMDATKIVNALAENDTHWEKAMKEF